MGGLGASIGGILGGLRGSILGVIIGAAIGDWIENRFRGASKSSGNGAGRQAGESELVVLGAIAAMMSKMAKADGVVTPSEIRHCERAFNRLGIGGEKREYCISVFRRAKGDSHTIYEYADSFADTEPSPPKTMTFLTLSLVSWALASAESSPVTVVMTGAL